MTNRLMFRKSRLCVFGSTCFHIRISFLQLCVQFFCSQHTYICWCSVREFHFKGESPL